MQEGGKVRPLEHGNGEACRVEGAARFLVEGAVVELFALLGPRLHRVAAGVHHIEDAGVQAIEQASKVLHHLVAQHAVIHDDGRSGIGYRQSPVKRIHAPATAQHAGLGRINGHEGHRLVLRRHEHHAGFPAGQVLCQALGDGGRSNGRPKPSLLSIDTLDHRDRCGSGRRCGNAPHVGLGVVAAFRGRFKYPIAAIAFLAGNGEDAARLDFAAPEYLGQVAVQLAVGVAQFVGAARVIVCKPDICRAIDAESLGGQGRGEHRSLRQCAFERTDDRQRLAVRIGHEGVETLNRALR